MEEIYEYRANVGKYSPESLAACGESSFHLKMSLFQREIRQISKSVHETEFKDVGITFTAEYTQRDIREHLKHYGLSPDIEDPSSSNTHSVRCCPIRFVCPIRCCQRVKAGASSGESKDEEANAISGAPKDRIGASSGGPENEEDVESSQSPEKPIDDFVSPIATEVYVQSRMLPIQRYLEREIPFCSFAVGTAGVLPLVGTLACAVFGATNLSVYIAFTALLIVTYERWVDFLGLQAWLINANTGIHELYDLHMRWKKKDALQKMMPAVRAETVLQTEQVWRAIVHAQTVEVHSAIKKVAAAE